MKEFEEIKDSVPVGQLTARETIARSKLLDEPTDDFKALAITLDDEGCEFPLTQAALMLTNSPGVAAKILENNGDS